jgi:hypothetical protein
MGTRSAQQEILLVKGNSFTARQYHFKNENGKTSSPSEQLEEACWNGLIHELIPELSEHAGEDKTMYLWKVKESNSFLELDLSEQLPETKDNYFSLDPYTFMPDRLMS